MPTVPIPSWTAKGLLPPTDESDPAGPARSPYEVSLVAVMSRFATSAARCRLLSGYLDYRAALHSNGYVSGFQWLSGSFLTDVESTEERAPRDIDVVSFLHTPTSGTVDADDRAALDHAAARERYAVNAHYVELNALPTAQIVAWTAYWYGLGSHQHDGLWKGLLRVDLRPAEDAEARIRLSLMEMYR